MRFSSLLRIVRGWPHSLLGQFCVCCFNHFLLLLFIMYPRFSQCLMCCPWWYPKFLSCIYLVLFAWIDIFRGIMTPLFIKCFSYSSYLVYASLSSWVALFNSYIYLRDLSVFLYWSFQMKSGLNKHYAALILLTVFLWPEEIWPHTLNRCSSLRSARLKCHCHFNTFPFTNVYIKNREEQ